jgi:ribonuclease P protein component
MLRRHHRFHGYNSLNLVYRHGKTARNTGGDISTRYLLHTKRDTFRVAVVVSKKVSKSAVVRNRIRRRIFEQVRACAEQIKAPYDIVITVHSERVREMPIAELQELIHGQFAQAGIVKD